MSLWRIVVVLSFVAVGVFFYQKFVGKIPVPKFLDYVWEDPEVRYKNGTLIRSIPGQKSGAIRPFDFEGYKIRPVASFAMKGRVLSKEEYMFDEKSDISPYDIVLGWQIMSDQNFSDMIDVSQGFRTFHIDYNNPRIKAKSMVQQMANLHIIPADELITDRIDDLVKGDIVLLKGYLVNVYGEDGFSWKTSLARDDFGENSGEVVFVKRFDIITERYKPIARID